MGLPSARQTTDFHCVTGWTVGGVHWQGVRLQTIWDMVEPLPEAKFANFVSLEEPYVDTLSLRQTTLPNVMLAHHMDGAPLTRAAWRAGAARDPRDVRLQEREVATRRSSSSRSSCRGTGRRTATTSTPGLGAPTATEYLHRFSRAERTAHWVAASTFLVMTATGLILYLPDVRLARRRPDAVEDAPHRRRGRLLGRARRRGRNEPAAARTHRLAARPLRRRRPRMARVGGAAARRRASRRPLQRRPEAQLGRDRRPGGGLHGIGRPHPAPGDRQDVPRRDERDPRPRLGDVDRRPADRGPHLPGDGEREHAPFAPRHHRSARCDASGPESTTRSGRPSATDGAGLLRGLAHPATRMRLPAVHVARPPRPPAARLAPARRAGAGRRRT